MNKKLGFFNLIVLGLATLIDQGSKSFVFGRTEPIWQGKLDWVHLVLQPTVNHNFAFSIPAPKWLILSVVLSVFFLVLYFWGREIKSNQQSSLWLALVIGGAIGNLLDRLFHGGVIDWIELTLFQWSWSSFNFADMIIVVGILGWFLASCHSDKQTKINE